MNRIEEARERYRPEYIKLIFIAEAPPCSRNRFFYFEDVAKGDSLFLHIIRAVFPDLDGWPTKQLRAKKEELLFRFMDSGYFLEHSVHESFPKGTTSKQKEQEMRAKQAPLVERLQPYQKHSKIVLISSMVFKVNHDFLVDNGYHVLNDFMIPYPGSGQQGKFKSGIAEIDLT
jgi:hypothetical protein